MKKILFIACLFSSLFAFSAVDPSYNIDIVDFKMRDPFVFVDTIGKSYFIHANSGDNKTFTVYQSKDLLKWKNLGKSFTAATDFWGKLDFWAPDMFLYNGKYYMIATFSSTTIIRGCGILVSNSPQGPYAPLVNNPITPSTLSCCDGTLYIDNGQPYLLFTGSPGQFGLGLIYTQKLSLDLKTTVGDPILLTRASNSPWARTITVNGVVGYAADAPFIYKNSKNELIMLWSSFSGGKYRIGIVRSTSGLMTGPWVHDAAPLNNDDGGHAMVFKSLDGINKISYHSPNAYPNYVIISDLSTLITDLTIPEEVILIPKLFPNPVRELLTIESDVTCMATVLDICDLTGKVVKQYLNSSLLNRFEISISDLPNATYIIRICTESGVVYSKKVTLRK
ncbi:MAG: family 43 glycosylhydrolase [Paludibacter sp.]